MLERMRQIDRKVTQAVYKPLVEIGSAMLYTPIGIIARLHSGARQEWINWVAFGALGNGRVNHWERWTLNFLSEPDRVVAEQRISSALREFRYGREASVT